MSLVIKVEQQVSGVTIFKMKIRGRSSLGYTIDQTILIVAIIAILVTIVIITVGWSLINKSKGASLASQMKQIEQANASFFVAYKVWPHQSYTAEVTGNASWANINALTGDASLVTYVTNVTSSPDYPRNFIPGLRFDSVTKSMMHNLGTYGQMAQVERVNPHGIAGRYLVIYFGEVPFSDVQQAELAIDGTENYQTGRITASINPNWDCYDSPDAIPPTTSGGLTVSACYVANALN